MGRKNNGHWIPAEEMVNAAALRARLELAASESHKRAAEPTLEGICAPLRKLEAEVEQTKKGGEQLLSEMMAIEAEKKTVLVDLADLPRMIGIASNPDRKQKLATDFEAAQAKKAELETAWEKKFEQYDAAEKLVARIEKEDLPAAKKACLEGLTSLKSKLVSKREIAKTAFEAACAELDAFEKMQHCI